MGALMVRTRAFNPAGAGFNSRRALQLGASVMT
jgi:hypothetical protein